MGFRVSWIARSGTSTQELLNLLGRRPTGERHDYPDSGHSLLELPSAESPRVLLIAVGTEYYMDLTASHAEMLSRGGHECLYFWCSETVMITWLTCFRDGKEAWSVTYNCEDEKMPLVIKGDVPKVAHEIVEELRAQEEDADSDSGYLFEVTGDLGLSIVGFRHDQDLETDDPTPFQVLGIHR